MTSAEKFDQILDEMLCNPDSESWQTVQGDDRSILALAHALVRLDVSPESGVQTTLRRELTNRRSSSEARTPLFGMALRKPRILAVATLVTLFLAWFATPLGLTLAQSGVEIVERWLVGESTNVVTVEGDFEVIPSESGEPVIQVPADVQGPPQEVEFASGGSLTVSAADFERAQSQTAFEIGLPGAAPTGYHLETVTIFFPDRVELNYTAEDHPGFISVLQTAVGGDGGRVNITASDDIQIISVDINGREGLWMDAGSEGLLVFEREGVNYQIAGTAELDQALVLAESLD